MTCPATARCVRPEPPGRGCSRPAAPGLFLPTRKAFPHWHYKPGKAGRKEFVRKVERLRKFRNRVAHHEPLHHRDLGDDHVSLITMAKFIDSELSQFISSHSRVPDVLARSARAIDHGVCQF